jgi:hypothetical protein
VAEATAERDTCQLGDESSDRVAEGRGGMGDCCLTVRWFQGCRRLVESGGGLVALIEVLKQFIEGALHRGYFIYYKV